MILHEKELIKWGVTGQAAGWSRDSMTTQDYPVLFSNGSVKLLGSKGGNASAINDAVEITGYEYFNGNAIYQAFFYRNGSMTRLGTLGGSNSLGHYINNAGQIVGRAHTLGNAAMHAFLYSGGTMTDLGTLGRKDSLAMGLNDFGQVVGWTSDSRVFEAFIFRDGAMAHFEGEVHGVQPCAAIVERTADRKTAGEGNVVQVGAASRAKKLLRARSVSAKRAVPTTYPEAFMSDASLVRLPGSVPRSMAAAARSWRRSSSSLRT